MQPTVPLPQSGSGLQMSAKKRGMASVACGALLRSPQQPSNAWNAAGKLARL